jgi:hypothetical protein
MAIGSHIIPKFYLEQFAVPSAVKNKPGRIWVYEKGEEPDERATSVQGKEKGYFGITAPDGTLDERFEEHLAELEADCNSTLVCAKSSLFDLGSLMHRRRLAFYMGLLFARSTMRRKFSASNWAKIKEPFSKLELDDEYVHDLATHFTDATGELVTPEYIRGMIRDHAAEFTKKDMTGNTFVQDTLFHAEVMKAELVSRPWQVWEAPTGIEFATSDNPVITFLRITEEAWHPGHGFRKPGVVVAFPLAPTTCLTIGTAGREFQTVDEATVIRLNELVVRCSDRFVYTKTLSTYIQEMMHSFARTSVPGENAFVGEFPGTKQIEEYLRKKMGVQRRAAIRRP